jgi:cytoskeletal protein RodZ
MEGLGKKLQEARLARNLTLDEAGRITKIRPGRLAEIENEDFSEFASLAYAKGFLLIYGKFLDVDVSPYLEAFETSESVTVDGYSYLQDNPAPKPARTTVVRPRSSGGGGGGGGRGSFMPFVVGVVVLVGGFLGMKTLLEVQRLKPGPQIVGVSPTTAPEKVIAPRAQLIENAPSVTPAAADTPVAQPTPAVLAAPSPISRPSAAEPEVRRAEPVNAQDLPKPKPSATPVIRRQLRSPTPPPRQMMVPPRPVLSPTPRKLITR